jgi:Kdo2-lipid IVA lauroyltransferase/acyltransferase
VLPFPALYTISSFFYIIVFYIIGYRKKVVTQNLKLSFPEKNDKELKKITKQFYAHFCDVIFETLKLLSISKEAFKKRCVLDEEAIQIFERFFKKNQSVIGVMGHCGNWEWGAMMHQVYFNRMITGVYHPLSNKNFDRLMIDLRSRFGGDIVPMSKLYKRLIELRGKNTPTTVGLIADQAAPPESAYWTTFLHQDTAVFNGPEKLAKKFNYPVLYLKTIKKKRGLYQLSVQVVTETPLDLPEGQITQRHTALLEDNIKEQPYAWLWTHKRWKHKKPN